MRRSAHEDGMISAILPLAGAATAFLTLLSAGAVVAAAAMTHMMM